MQNNGFCEYWQGKDICEYCSHYYSVSDEWEKSYKHCKQYCDDEIETNFDGIEVNTSESLSKIYKILYNDIYQQYLNHCGVRIGGDFE